MFRIAIALLLAAPLVGQTASVTSYGTPCPAGTAQLATQGLPRLGATLTVAGVFPQTCRSGWGGIGLCAQAFLILGASRSNATVSLPGLGGDGCPILASTDVYLLGDANDEVNLRIPNDTRLLGLRFYLQRVEARWIVSAPTGSYSFSGVSFSNGVECVIGP